MAPDRQDDWVEERIVEILEEAREHGIEPIVMYAGFMGGASNVKEHIDEDRHGDTVEEIERAMLNIEKIDSDDEDDDDDDGNFKIGGPLE